MKPQSGQTDMREDRRYRVDIDCLRALAVLVVIGFHWHVAGFQGGYVGVDVFFVISGFLITGYIVDQLRGGTFSFSTFYLRRLRRLAPALLFMMLASSLAAALLLPLTAIADFARSSIAVLLLGSNVWFYLRTGYFDKPALEKPLLHTWSLAVEEQFYLVVPALLWVAARYFRSNRTLGLAVLLPLAVASFALCWAQTIGSRSAAFYLAPDRAWEFFLGSGLALARYDLPRKVSVALATIGAALIAYSVVSFTEATAFPGPAALIPCIGAALVIAARLNIANAATRAGAAVGRVSYSLYLWHWPVFVFWRAAFGATDRALELSALTALTLVLSVGSYLLVEQPLRTRRLIAGARPFVVANVMAIVAVAGMAGYLLTLQGRAQGEAARLYRYAEFPFEQAYRGRTCFLLPDQPATDYKAQSCFAYEAGRRNVLLWGDSLSAHLLPGLQSLAAAEGFNLLQADYSACPPLLDVVIADRPACRDFNTATLRRIAEHPDMTVILSAAWSYYETPERLGRERVLAELLKTVAALEKIGARPIVVGPTFTWKEPLLTYLLRNIKPDPKAIDTQANFDRTQFETDRRLSAGVNGAAPYFSILGSMCPGERCPAFVGDAPVTWDDHHLTREGSAWVAEKMAATLKRTSR